MPGVAPDGGEDGRRAAAAVHAAAAAGDAARLARLFGATCTSAGARGTVELAGAPSKGMMAEAPLHAAVEGGHAAAARELLAAGASHGVRDAAGATPLHYAATRGAEEVRTEPACERSWTS